MSKTRIMNKIMVWFLLAVMVLSVIAGLLVYIVNAK